MTEIGERRAGVSGVGQSQIGRRIYREPLALTLDACLAAIEDAGLDRSDIDGLSTYPGGMDQPPGFSGVAIEHVQDALRLDLNWFMGGRESPGQLGSVVNAIAAVSTGLCKHVLCFRTVTEASAAGDQGRASVTMGAGGGGGGKEQDGSQDHRKECKGPAAAGFSVFHGFLRGDSFSGQGRYFFDFFTRVNFLRKPATSLLKRLDSSQKGMQEE